MEQLTIDDVASADDANWFAAHPGMTSRTRKRIPGEMAGIASDFDLVMVVQLHPGVRARTPIQDLMKGVNDG